MIAITFALPAESSGVVAAVQSRRNDGAVIHGKLMTRDVAIFHTGVGQRACETAIQQFLPAIQPTFLISAGFAGGVDERLEPGDRLIATNYSDPRFLELLLSRSTNKKRKIGKLFSAASIIDSPDERAQIARENSAAAVDMETAFIARACHARQIPMVSIRAITDTADAPFPVPAAVLFDVERQKTKPAALIFYLARHPAAIPPLIAFAREIQNARRGLTADVCAFVHALDHPFH